jgi:hypothetical protein
MEARGIDVRALDRHQPVVPDPDYELRVFRERLRAPRGERLLARARRAVAR